MKLCLPAQPLRVLLLFGFAVLCIHWLLSAPGDINARANEMKKTGTSWVDCTSAAGTVFC